MAEQTKKELLDHIENMILWVAGDIRIHCVMAGDPTGALAKNEERLGDMLKDIIALKEMEGIPRIDRGDETPS